MTVSNMFKKCMQHIGLISFGIILVFSVFFYQERTLFLDNAFQVFLMIVDGNIVVNADRWPATIVRFLPFLFIKIKAPLKWVLLSFSISYWLYHFIIFLIVRYGLKERVLSLLQLSTVTIPLVHSFFWCNSELNLAMSLLILTFALYKKNHLLIAACLSLIMLWLHPLIFIPYAFLMIWEGIDRFYKNDYKISKAVWSPMVIGLGYVILFLLKKTFIKNWYDTMKENVFNANLEKYNFINTEFISTFFVDANILFPFFFVLALGFLVFQRRLIAILYFLVFMICYLYLLDISRSEDAGLVFYNEVNYLIVFFAAALILKDGYKKLKVPFKMMAYVLLVIWVSYNWKVTAEFYQGRIDWMSDKAEKNDRVILPIDEELKEKLVLDWGAPYESLVMSSLSGTSQTFIIENKHAPIEVLNSDTVFYGSFKRYPINYINGKYYFDLEIRKYRHNLDKSK